MRERLRVEWTSLTPLEVRTDSSGAMLIVPTPYPLVFDLDRVEFLEGPLGTLFGAEERLEGA